MKAIAKFLEKFFSFLMLYLINLTSFVIHSPILLLAAIREFFAVITKSLAWCFKDAVEWGWKDPEERE